jgi:DNA-binding transcriptional ArsR family regulator
MDNKVLSGLLNPVRMRILQILMRNETATTRVIAEDLPNVPAASLYRHINKLVEDDILEICGEKKIRGTVEKLYRLKNNPFKLIEELAEKGGREDYYNIFYTFAMTLLMDFNNYSNIENYNMLEDRVGFRSFPLYLSDEECDEFLNILKTALIKVVDNKPNNGRRLRKFSYVIMPEEEKGRG